MTLVERDGWDRDDGGPGEICRGPAGRVGTRLESSRRPQGERRMTRRQFLLLPVVLGSSGLSVISLLSGRSRRSRSGGPTAHAGGASGDMDPWGQGPDHVVVLSEQMLAESSDLAG